MKKLNKVQNIVIILMILVIATIVVYLLIVFMPNKSDNIIKTQETIKYDYVLYERDNDLYEDTFKKLKEALNSESINYEKYAEYISELFVIDFYTLDNKNTKNDVGGVQYLYTSMKENFVLKATDTIYKYVENSSNRTKELPEVSNIELVSVEKSEYIIEAKAYESYIVNLKWEYKTDLEYDKTGTFTLIKDGEKLFVIEKE